MHKSAGAIIIKDSKYLLIDRATPPYGFAGPAGHVDENETPEAAVVREVREETGLEMSTPKLLLEESVEWNECSKGITGHYWYLFQGEAVGEIKPNLRETESVAWYTAQEIRELKLEPVWEHWFKKLKVI